MENRCVICGAIIPEGREVCPNCEAGKIMGRKYCGKDWYQMNNVLSIMCDIEDRIETTDEEKEAFDIAIQCITTVLNRMKEDRPIAWD